MNVSDVPLVIHVGYPKTATTTFQRYVFPRHPEIEYLGKLIPSFQYVDDKLYDLIDEILHRGAIGFRGSGELRTLVGRLRNQSARKCVVLSSESFIHPSVIDIGTVADRLCDAFGPCKIMITIREQISAILSFYWMHGRYGQYLTIGPKEEADRLSYPIPFSDWLRFQKRAVDHNHLGTLHYDAVIDHYGERFGADNVGVFLYEVLKADPNGYARDLGTFLGVDVPTLRTLMADRHELQSKGRLEPWDKVHASALAAASQSPGLPAVLGKLLGTWPVNPPHDPMKEEIIALQETFRAGNARLAQQRSLPLERFGYCV